MIHDRHSKIGGFDKAPDVEIGVKTVALDDAVDDRKARSVALQQCCHVGEENVAGGRGSEADRHPALRNRKAARREPLVRGARGVCASDVDPCRGNIELFGRHLHERGEIALPEFDAAGENLDPSVQCQADPVGDVGRALQRGGNVHRA